MLPKQPTNKAYKVVERVSPDYSCAQLLHKLQVLKVYLFTGANIKLVAVVVVQGSIHIVAKGIYPRAEYTRNRVTIKLIT